MSYVARDNKNREFLAHERNQVPALRRAIDQLEATIQRLDAATLSVEERVVAQKHEARLRQVQHRINERVEKLTSGALETEYELIMQNVYDHPEQDKLFEREVLNNVPQQFACSSCNSIDVVYDSTHTFITCEQCGATEAGISSTMYNGAIPHGQVIFFKHTEGYKRLNHFKEKLSLKQNKELGIVHEDVKHELSEEFRKHSIDPAHCTQDQIIFFLKKLGYAMFRDQAPQLHCYFTGAEPVRISGNCEERLKWRFSQVSNAWDEMPPEMLGGRSSFMNYDYVGRQLAILEQEYVFAESFPKLKGDAILHNHNRLWQWLCERLEWPYHEMTRL